MPGRNYTSSGYRYGFNGQLKDDEVYGAGNLNTAEFWQYDTRLGRRWNLDSVVKPWESSYSVFGGNPILHVDPKGDDWFVNKATGAVVFIKGKSKVSSEYGKNENWENLGKDNMFDKKGGISYSKKHSLMYMDAKSAKGFMKQQGYTRGKRMVIERTTYEDKSPEGGPGESIVSQIIEEKILANDVTYVTSDNLDKENIVSTNTKRMVTGVLTKTVDQVNVVKTDEEKSSEETLGNDSFKNVAKFFVEKVADKFGEAVIKLFKRR